MPPSATTAFRKAECIANYLSLKGRDPDLLENAYAAGMLRPETLVDNQKYVGFCRSAYQARWSAKLGRFVHFLQRYNGQLSAVELVHPAHDGDPFFVPVRAMTEADRV